MPEFNALLVPVDFSPAARKAFDYAVELVSGDEPVLKADAIVMGKYGLRGQIDPYLFGTTAEYVDRGSTRPVIVLPEAATPVS